MSDPGTPSQSQEVFHGNLLAVRVETIASPSGAQRYEIVEHPDAVAIVALRDDPAGNEPQVALVRQSRPAIGRETWELPAGLVRVEERGEPQRTAVRELREETGCVAFWRQT
jgi:8-oxo-dGTP pyrophosphatase MutT (NUDIX family)